MPKSKDPHLEDADADIVLHMLYFCEDGPKLPYQIMSFCGIDRAKFTLFSEHCLKRGLLRMQEASDGMYSFELTVHGKQVLETAEDIMKHLGLEIVS